MTQGDKVRGRLGEVKIVRTLRLSNEHPNDIVATAPQKTQMLGASDNGHLGRNIMRSAIRILALCALGSTLLAGSTLADTWTWGRNPGS